jgi:site-specific DNA-methyltransferase (adenine-specific)
MQPYYDDGHGIVIYHGDCLEILPSLPSVDLVITDPPYNCGKNYGGHNDSMTVDEYTEWCIQRVAACKSKSPNQFWVAPRYKLDIWLNLLKGAHLIVIERGASGPFRQGWSDQFEIALAMGNPKKCLPDLWSGIRLKGEGYFFREETYGHPGYTPQPIFQRAVEAFLPKSIIDPFCGTGTSLRVAKDVGASAIGIELNEAYAEIAARRMSQEVLPFNA